MHFVTSSHLSDCYFDSTNTKITRLQVHKWKIMFIWFIGCMQARQMKGPSFESGLRLQLSKTPLPTIYYTWSLAPADFSGAVFTCAHFQRIAQIFSLCDFHYISKIIPSLMHFGYYWPKCCGFGSCIFLPDLKKKHEPRTGCIASGELNAKDSLSAILSDWL